MENHVNNHYYKKMDNVMTNIYNKNSSNHIHNDYLNPYNKLNNTNYRSAVRDNSLESQINDTVVLDESVGNRSRNLNDSKKLDVRFVKLQLEMQDNIKKIHSDAKT